MQLRGAPVRFAIVGCGGMGRVHAATIASLPGLAEVTATVSSRSDAARELAAEYGATPFTSLEEALAGGSVDAVAVCTPSARHADAAVAALRAGRHVLIEKPLDVTSVAASRIAAAAATSGATVSVVSQHRFDPASVALKRAIDEGGLGRLTSGLVSVALWRTQAYYEAAEWRRRGPVAGGGVLLNQAVHQVDLLVWLMGRPSTVSAEIATLAHPHIDVEDTAAATIRFASGALASVHATTCAYPGTSTRVHVFGTTGSAVIERDQLTYFHAAEGAPAPGDDGRLAQNQADAVMGDGGRPGTNIEALARQYVDFLDAVERGRPPLVGLADAARTLAVIEAFYTSARTGRPASVRESGDTRVRESDGGRPARAAAGVEHEPGGARAPRGCAQ